MDISRTTVWRRVTEVASQTSIEKKVTPHVLRHTYGTQIAANGASAQFIKQTTFRRPNNTSNIPGVASTAKPIKSGAGDIVSM